MNDVLSARVIARILRVTVVSGLLAACSANGGGSANIAPIILNGSPQLPAVALTVAPQAIQAGESALLTWTSSDATACEASGSWSGAQALSNTTGGNTGPKSEGTYSYGLTCTGPGGSNSAVATLVVGQTAAPEVSLQLTPASIRPGDTATLTWSSTNATSCSGSGGSGTDGWAGARTTSNATGFIVGPFSSVGSYSYTLDCTGPGGSSGDSRILTISDSAPAAPPGVTLTASRTQIRPGESTTLSWTSSNALSCMASGGANGDGWAGSQPVSSSGTSVGPITTAGTYTYALSCAGGGGSASASTSVVVTTNPQSALATLDIMVDPLVISTGMSASLAWTTTNVDSCQATGSWSGSKPLVGSGVSTGTLTVAGVYSYTLTCSGPGGSVTDTAALTVNPATVPPATIVSLTASPNALQIGDSFTLQWTTENATTCSASGGAGSDGWSGTVAVTNAGLVIGPLSTSGTYTYSLTCSGPGGASSPAAVSVSVGAVTPASVTSLTASPNSIQTGQSILLSWTTANATSCTATGGTGSDGWSGTVAISSAGTSIGPISSEGTFTYTLTCSGPGGTGASSSATVTVSPAPVGPPTVSIWANDANPAQIQPGQSLVLKWATTNAASCTASGGSGADSWSGSQPTSSSGTSVGTISTPGIYTYTLTCVGAGGSSAASVVVTVLSSDSVDCGIGTPSTALLAPAASVNSAVNGLCLAGCGVANAPLVIDADMTNFATMSVALGVAAYDSLRVTDSTTSYPAGRKAGFLIAEPGKLLSLSVLQNVTVHTLLNGTLQESATAATTLELSALGSFADPEEGFIGFTTSKPFNAVRLDVGSLASVDSSVNVYGACVTLQ